MALADKINILGVMKSELKQAIENLGVNLSEIPFRNYAQKIAEIEVADPPVLLWEGDSTDVQIDLTGYEGVLVFSREYADTGQGAFLNNCSVAKKGYPVYVNGTSSASNFTSYTVDDSGVHFSTYISAYVCLYRVYGIKNFDKFTGLTQ